MIGGGCDAVEAAPLVDDRIGIIASLTVASAVPCQTEIFGQGPWCGEAARTSASSAGASGRPWPRIRSNACGTEAATPCGNPAMIAPPANSSG